MSAEPAHAPLDAATELAGLKARFARLELLQRVGEVMHSTLDPQAAFQLITREMVGALKASSGSLVLVNPTTNLLEILAVRDCPRTRSSCVCGPARA